MFSPNRWASSLDSSSVFPCSLVRIGAISSTLPSMFRAALCRISALLAGASLDQVENAFAAACAALSTSAAPPAGTWSTTSPVAGLRTSYVLPDAARVLSPSMIIVAIRHPSSCGLLVSIIIGVVGYGPFGGHWHCGEAPEGRRGRDHRARPTTGEHLRLCVSARGRGRNRRRAPRPRHPVGCRGHQRVRVVLLGRRGVWRLRRRQPPAPLHDRGAGPRSIHEDGEHSARLHRRPRRPLPGRRARAGTRMRPEACRGGPRPDRASP